eukprot:3900835-Amphidinium_carterae.1
MARTDHLSFSARGNADPAGSAQLLHILGVQGARQWIFGLLVVKGTDKNMILSSLTMGGHKRVIRGLHSHKPNRFEREALE